MVKEQIVNLYDVLKNINVAGVKFNYGIAKNIALLKPEVDALLKAQEASEGFKEYDKERIELAKKHAKKDEKGNPVSENGRFILESEEEFNTELLALQEKHKEAYKEREKQLEDFSKLLKEDKEITFHKIKLEDIPSEITTHQLTAIYEFIEE